MRSIEREINIGLFIFFQDQVLKQDDNHKKYRVSVKLKLKRRRMSIAKVKLVQVIKGVVSYLKEEGEITKQGVL